MPSTAAVPVRRWRVLDALRGFAISGILFVNAADITFATFKAGGSHGSTVRTILDYTVQGRFVPLFVFLFGMSMWFTRRSADRKGVNPWVPLLLRMVSIFAIGMLLWVTAYPGNILAEYGVVGLVMIPFVVLCPPWLNLVLGLVLTVVSFGMFGGGLASLPGLILLGQAAARWEWFKRLETPNRAMVLFTLAMIVCAVPAVWWQTMNPGDPRFSNAGGVAGGVMAAAYLGLFAVACWSPARGAILAVFEPMGKMALTNYVMSAVVVALVALVVDFPNQTSLVPLMGLVVVIIAAQSVLSRLWLAHFTYGPFEWLWRVATWRSVVPLRKRAVPAGR